MLASLHEVSVTAWPLATSLCLRTHSVRFIDHASILMTAIACASSSLTPLKEADLKLRPFNMAPTKSHAVKSRPFVARAHTRVLCSTGLSTRGRCYSAQRLQYLDMLVWTRAESCKLFMGIEVEGKWCLGVPPEQHSMCELVRECACRIQ